MSHWLPNPAPGTSAPVCEPTASAGRGDPGWEGSSIITKFDGQYAGHVDMSDIRYTGIPVNERRFPNEHLVTGFRQGGQDRPHPGRMGKQWTERGSTT
jgi:hypothetical protein